MGTTHQHALRSPKEVRNWFESHGVSVSEWAKARGFAIEVVYSVLSGRARGQRGQAHQVAVALGIKPEPTGKSPLDISMPDPVTNEKVAQIK